MVIFDKKRDFEPFNLFFWIKGLIFIKKAIFDWKYKIFRSKIPIF